MSSISLIILNFIIGLNYFKKLICLPFMYNLHPHKSKQSHLLSQHIFSPCDDGANLTSSIWIVKRSFSMSFIGAWNKIRKKHYFKLQSIRQCVSNQLQIVTTCLQFPPLKKAIFNWYNINYTFEHCVTGQKPNMTSLYPCLTAYDTICLVFQVVYNYMDEFQ